MTSGGVRRRNQRIYPRVYTVVCRPDVSRVVQTGFELTPDEEELVSRYGLDREQLSFERKKIAQNGIDLLSRNIQQSLKKPS